MSRNRKPQHQVNQPGALAGKQKLEQYNAIQAENARRQINNELMQEAQDASQYLPEFMRNNPAVQQAVDTAVTARRGVNDNKAALIAVG